MVPKFFFLIKVLLRQAYAEAGMCVLSKNEMRLIGLQCLDLSALEINITLTLVFIRNILFI